MPALSALVIRWENSSGLANGPALANMIPYFIGVCLLAMPVVRIVSARGRQRRDHFLDGLLDVACAAFRTHGDGGPRTAENHLLRLHVHDVENQCAVRVW